MFQRHKPRFFVRSHYFLTRIRLSTLFTMRGFLRARLYTLCCAQEGFKSPENNPDDTKHVKNIFKLKSLELKRSKSKQLITFNYNECCD